MGSMNQVQSTRTQLLSQFFFSAASLFAAPLIFAALLTLTACSMGTTARPPAEDKSPIGPSYAVELTMARTSLTGTDYELYKLEGTTLWHECGKVQRGRFGAREENLVSVARSTVEDINALTASLLSDYHQNPPILPRPGTLNSLLDPGQFSLQVTSGAEGTGIRTLELRTSLDAAANGESKPTARLQRLAFMLRSIPEQAPCSLEAFFGIKRSSR